MPNNNLINKQIVANILFIIFLIIAIYLLHQIKDKKINATIILSNKIFLVIIYAILLLIAYESYKESHHDMDLFALIAAIIAIIPPIIILYVYLYVKAENISGFKNPTI